jgi:hypothetical protein
MVLSLENLDYIIEPRETKKEVMDKGNREKRDLRQFFEPTPLLMSRSVGRIPLPEFLIITLLQG